MRIIRRLISDEINFVSALLSHRVFYDPSSTFATRWRFDNPLLRNSGPKCIAVEEGLPWRRNKRARERGRKREILIVRRVYVYTGDVRSVGPACGPYCVPKGHIR